ncbi:hypothetical protein [uncultured Pseudodesulfovibrio sp.]|uniref:hypothetical protein n=1 Tax=uncultured Pseudodesulfovibrio sp. TaxID=2035858 RepID=UPI0029C8CC6C|nr:hypothetical protein [uncultured Pseudodesulfovibrio sp.]
MKRMSLLSALLVGIVALIAFSGVGGASNMGNLVNKACSPCHSTKRICLNVGVKSEKAWVATVQRMVDAGAPLGADMVAPVASYLAGMAPGSGPVCD